MFTAMETIPREELERRWARCRAMLAAYAPGADGLLAFSRVGLYYFTGHVGNGLFWLPAEGEPVLLCRRGAARARLESAVSLIGEFRSYCDVPAALAEIGSPLGKTVAVQMNGLSWGFGRKLERCLPDARIVRGDMVLSMTRARKTNWELAKLEICGRRHHRVLHDLVPGRIRPGMTEREISHAIWDISFAEGHMGLLRMGALDGENFQGHVAAGDSANYPSVFDGPVGIRGEHPAVPFMGYAGKVWRRGEPLVCDVGFSLEGYITDKTQVYWAGPESSIPDEARRSHEFCMRAQETLARRMVPGAVPSELYAEIMAECGRLGLERGFMSLDGNKVVFLGHGIGLVVDEFPVIAAGVDTPLEENMVMALEPKYGVPGLGMVGVENTFVVTPDGARSLTGEEDAIVCIE